MPNRIKARKCEDHRLISDESKPKKYSSKSNNKQYTKNIKDT